MKTWVVRVHSARMDEETLAYRLRTGQPPAMARIHEGLVQLDMRTILEAQEEPLAEAVGWATGEGPG
jgi:hypothetical protein